MTGAWARQLGGLLAAKLDYGELALAAAALAGMMALGYLVLALVKRRLGREQQAVFSQPFTLDQLRGLYQNGQLTEAEYERAKAKMAQRYGVGQGACKTAGLDLDKGDAPNQDGTSSS